MKEYGWLNQSECIEIDFNVQVVVTNYYSSEVGGIIPNSGRILCKLMDRLYDTNIGKLKLQKWYVYIP